MSWKDIINKDTRYPKGKKFKEQQEGMDWAAENMHRRSAQYQFKEHIDSWMELQRDIMKDWKDSSFPMTPEDEKKILEQVTYDAVVRKHGNAEEHAVWQELDEAWHKMRSGKSKAHLESTLPQEPTFDLQRAQKAYDKVVLHVHKRFANQKRVHIPAMNTLFEVEKELKEVKTNIDMHHWIQKFKMKVVTLWANDYFEWMDFDRWLINNGP